MKWKEAIFIEPMLPFGLRSAPKIVNAVADALHWHLRQAGIQNLFQYLDDFIMVASPNSPNCQRWLETLLSECCRLGVPIASHKMEGPTTTLTFLGIEMDVIKGKLRLPGEKLVRLRGEVGEVAGRVRGVEALKGLYSHCPGVTDCAAQPCLQGS